MTAAGPTIAGIGHRAQITRVRDSILTAASVVNNVIHAIHAGHCHGCRAGHPHGDAGARAGTGPGGAIAGGQAAGN